MAQEVISGVNTITTIKDLLAKHGCRHPLIITGEHLHQQRSTLFPFAHTPWIKNATNVLQEEIDTCTAAFTAHNNDAIIAVGGGSVMDLGKAVLYHAMQKNNTLPFFICAPTTAGSGSEATKFAVVYRNKIKASLEAGALLPQVVILDPQLTYSLSPKQTAIPGIDALAQAIESYWNINATGESRAFSTEAIPVLLEYLPRAVSEPTPVDREKVLWAAHLAGKAVNVTRTTGPHALSYYLTANYQVPHGQAVAFFLPVFFLYNGGSGKGNNAMQQLYQLLQVNNAEDAASFMRQFMKRLGLAVKLDELGINKHDVFDPLLSNIDQQRFSNNPVALDKEALKNLCIDYL